MTKKDRKNLEAQGLREVKTAGFTANKKVKRDRSVNRRAGLHDKLKNLQGEARVKRRKPLGIKHVRRIRKFAAVASLGVVGAISVVGVGFLQPKQEIEPNELIAKENLTSCYEPPIDGVPTDYTLEKNIGYLNYVLQNQPYWSSVTTTTVNAMMGVEQGVDSYKQYYNGVLISADCSFSSLSESMQYGEQFCQYNGVVLTRDATSNKTDELKKGMDAPWSTAQATAWSVDNFMIYRGMPPLEFSVYILKEATIANANDYTVTDNGDGTYTMVLELNVSTGNIDTSADYYYGLQMQYNGGLNERPTIYYTTLTYTYDADWRVLKLEVDDSYRAKAMGINSNCTSHSVTIFSYDEESAKNTFWEDYFKAEYERVAGSIADEEVVIKEETPTAMGYLGSAFGSVVTEGAIFKVDLNIDNLDLNGAVCVEMEDGGFSGLSAKLGDILVWLDGSTLYVNDGTSKYKLDTKALTSGGEESGVSTQGLTDGLDLATLMNQMTSGEFVFDKETGFATLNSEVELFGLKIPMEFEFQKTEDGVELNFLKAQICLGEKTVNATLRFGNESDKPAIPADTKDYQDILNEGVTLDISLNANGFALDGVAKIIMQNGEFKGVCADLGNITVYYDCPHNMLYLSVGNAKYKLDISKLNSGDASGADLSATFGSLDLNSLLNEVLANLATTESSLGTSLNIDALGSVLKVALGVQLSGGLKVNAGLSLDNLNVSVSAALSNEEVKVPELTGYQDILNSEITLDVSLTLMTGLTDGQTGKRDEVTLEGKVALCLAGGAVTEIRADFGNIAVCFDFSANSLYLKVGTTKVMLNLDEMDLTDASVLSALSGSEIIPADLPDALKEFLTNLIGDGKIISSNANLNLLGALVPVWAELDLSEALSVRAGLSLLGVDAEVRVKLSETSLEGLSDEVKEEYVDVLKEARKIVESLIGNHITATVEGALYSDDEIKYSFTAALEYDKGTVSVDEAGVEVDSKAYVHLNIALTAMHPDDDSLYLDVVLMDANPVTGTDGKTTGGYTKDGKFDIYLSVSNRSDNPVPLKIYAPVDEILTLISMVGAMANLDGITVENSAELTTAIGEIASLLDEMLISKYLPKSVQDKFASLGDSLIPQILGVSLEELLNNLFGNVEETAEKAQGIDFSLSDEYVSSITTTDESLIFVLNSSLIYNSEIGAEDNLTVTFDRVLKDGVYFVGGVNLENIFFGENLSNKLNLGLKLGYDEIARPNASTGFKGYLNADGLDTLLNGLINSATHKVEGTEDSYDLNHYYLLNGSVNAGISVIGININVAIQIKSLAVYIDENNEVAIDAHIYYDGVQELNQIAINGDTDVYISIRNGNIVIKRIQYTHWEKSLIITKEVENNPAEVEIRAMTLEEFSANLMDNITFIFNFGPVITDNISNAGSSENSGVSFEGKDFGECLNTVISSYLFEETSAGASWTVALQGGLIQAYTGMTTSNIPVKFSADLNEDGSYTVKSLDILKTTMQLFGSAVTLNVTGGLTYCNPNEQMGEGYDDTSKNLFAIKADIYSEYSLGENVQTHFTAECGSLIKLPLNVTATVNGEAYVLDGYTDGTGNVQFEGYVEEDGVRYGLVTLADDTVYTAIWHTAYTVTFTDENGNILYSVIYREGEVLNFGNMPECPELEGYTVQWVDENGAPANGTAVTGNATYKLEYVKTPLKVTLNSTVDFNYTGYDGTYKSLNVGFEEGSSYVLAETTAEGYTFVGWWYQDNGNWRQVTSVEEFVDAGTVTLEALWLKADISVTSTRDTYRKNVFSTLYYYYYFESEVSYHFEGDASLIENITCTNTTFTMHYSNKKGNKDYPYSFDGYQGKLEQQQITLEDSWDSAKYDSWNMVVTLTFTLPDGSTWSTPQTGAFSLTGNY